MCEQFEILKEINIQNKPLFETEKIDIILKINENISIIELFDIISLTEHIPVAIFRNFTKILKKFILPFDVDWDDNRFENAIILKVKYYKDDTEDFKDVYISKLNNYILIKFKIDVACISEIEMIDRILNVIGNRPYEKQVNNIEGTINIPNMNFETYILADLIMNDPTFSSILLIDEFKKTTKDRTDIFIIFNTNNINYQTDPDCIINKSIVVKSYLTSKKDNDEEYIRIKITKANNIENINFYLDIMLRLFNLYNIRKEEIINFYNTHLPKIKIQKKKKTEPQKKIDSYLAKLKKIDDNVFLNGYPRFCQTYKFLQTVTQEEYDNMSLEQKEDIMIFPKTGKKAFYLCNKDKIEKNKKYPFIGLKTNTLDNKKKYPYVPCCFTSNQKLKEKSKYNLYYETKDEEVTTKDSTQQKIIILKKKNNILKHNTLSEIPTSLQTFFNSLDSEYKYIRIGSHKNTSSFLECILKIKAQQNNQEYNTKQYRNKYKNYDKNIFSICKQEAYDIDIEEIQNIAMSEDKYFDPKLFIRLLEHEFNLNIFLFERTNNQTSMIIPNHTKGYYKYKKNAPVVCILIHMGSEIDKALHPQCEIICTYKNDNIKYYMDYNSDISRNIKIYYNQMFESYSLNTKITEIDFSNFMKLNIISQIIDTNGKMRTINILYKNTKISICLPPLPPINVKQSNQIFNTNIDTATSLLKYLGATHIKQQKNTLGNVQATIQNINIKIPVIQHTNSILEKYKQNKKLASYLTQYFIYMFSDFWKDTNNDDINQVIQLFMSQKTIIDTSFKYTNIQKKFLDNINVFSKNGKFVMQSEEMKNRLLYTLSHSLKYDLHNIKYYDIKNNIEKLYRNVSDFDINSNQIILEGPNSIQKWYIDTRKILTLYDSVINITSPYFFKNKIISKHILLAQNYNNLEDAIQHSTQRYNTKNDLIYNTLKFTLYLYNSSTHIKSVIVKGTKNPYNIRIIAWKILDIVFYTSLLSM